jgi:hypothetical protein
MNIGFTGLWIMGNGDATNLEGHDHSIAVFNGTRKKTDSPVADGARCTDSPAALAPEVEVIEPRTSRVSPCAARRGSRVHSCQDGRVRRRA